MSPRTVFLVVLVLASAAIAQNSSKNEWQQQPPAARIVDFKTPDVVLKGTYFSAGKPGPGVLLFHQSNRTRTSWDDVARQLAAAGINSLTIDERGYGESGGKKETRELYHDGDLDAAFEYLTSQTGVQRDVIG